eukprot:1806519-Pyramimonas_sp.AAC.1
MASSSTALPKRPAVPPPDACTIVTRQPPSTRRQGRLLASTSAYVDTTYHQQLKPRSRLSASHVADWQSVGREYMSNIRWNIRNAVC